MLGNQFRQIDQDAFAVRCPHTRPVGILECATCCCNCKIHIVGIAVWRLRHDHFRCRVDHRNIGITRGCADFAIDKVAPLAFAQKANFPGLCLGDFEKVHDFSYRVLRFE